MPAPIAAPSVPAPPGSDPSLAARRDRARAWLFDAALPLWLDVGPDRDRGGWHDRVGQDAVPVIGDQRARVQARQAFVYAEAGRLGWGGDWAFAVEHGIDQLERAFKRPDGFYRKTVTATGAPADDGVDLYDQAFALFAFAAGWRALGREAWRDAAFALFDRMQARLAHPAIGFEEANPRVLPLRANPHMHLLEALLAWVAAGVDDPFADAARALVRLAQDHLIDPETGAIGEYYDGDWGLAAGPDGGVREPGHQFEWSYLLRAADRQLGGDHGAASDALYAFGLGHGIDRERMVAVFSTDARGQVTEPVARLWAQTEWLRAAVVRGDTSAAADAADTVWRFLDVPVPGLWRDKVDGDGRFVDEPAPASSFYHILTGILPLIDG